MSMMRPGYSGFLAGVRDFTEPLLGDLSLSLERISLMVAEELHRRSPAYYRHASVEWTALSVRNNIIQAFPGRPRRVSDSKTSRASIASLAARGLNYAEVARAVGVSRQWVVHTMARQKREQETLALRLAKAEQLALLKGYSEGPEFPRGEWQVWTAEGRQECP